jgi:hypothetical protein
MKWESQENGAVDDEKKKNHGEKESRWESKSF